MSRSIKVVLIATFFNVLAEYSIRGFNNLLEMPLLPFGLFLNYFTYFLLLEHLIIKYKLNDVALAVLANLFGLLWMAIGPSIIWFPQTFLGINWQRLFFVNFFWWVPIQTVLAFYLATRFIKRSWGKPLLSKPIAWIILVCFLIVTFTFRVFTAAPFSIIGFIVLLFLIIMNSAILLSIFRKSKSKVVPVFRKDKTLDFICYFLVVYFIFSSVYFREKTELVHVTYLNQRAVFYIVRISMIVVIILIIRRLLNKKSISI